MTQIQEFCRFFDDLENESPDLRDHNWELWIQNPATKCFLDFIFVYRLNMLKENMAIRNRSTEESMRDYFWNSGAYEALGIIVEVINEHLPKKEKKNA